MRHACRPTLLFGPGLPGGRGSGSYRAMVLCPVCRAPFPPAALYEALEDLRLRGVGSRFLERFREHASQDLGLYSSALSVPQLQHCRQKAPQIGE